MWLWSLVCIIKQNTIRMWQSFTMLANLLISGRVKVRRKLHPKLDERYVLKNIGCVTIQTQIRLHCSHTKTHKRIHDRSFPFTRHFPCLLLLPVNLVICKGPAVCDAHFIKMEASNITLVCYVWHVKWRSGNILTLPCWRMTTLGGIYCTNLSYYFLKV